MEWLAHGPDLNILRICEVKLNLNWKKQAYDMTTKTKTEATIRNIWTNIPFKSKMIRNLMNIIKKMTGAWQLYEAVILKLSSLLI